MADNQSEGTLQPKLQFRPVFRREMTGTTTNDAMLTLIAGFPTNKVPACGRTDAVSMDHVLWHHL